MAVSPELFDAFRWPQKTADALIEWFGADALRRSALCTSRRYSTYFSGFGTYELGLKSLSNAFARHGVRVAPIQSSACDNDPKCQAFLLRNGSGHLFRSIESMFIMPPHFQNSWTYNMRFYWLQQAPLRSSVYCLRSRTLCQPEGVSFCVSGSLCTPYSSSGPQARLEHSESHLFYLWARLHTLRRTPVLFHENVPGFPVSWARLCLPDHIIIVLDVSPEHVGFEFLSRRRQYIIGVHRQRAQLVANIESVYEFLCSKLQKNDLHPGHALIADRHEVGQAAYELCTVRGIPYNPVASDLAYILTDHQKTYLENYHRKWVRQGFKALNGPAIACPWLVFNLGDTGAEFATWSAVSGRLPTYRRTWQLFWYPFAKRWATPRERLATLGFPVYHDLAVAAGTSMLVLDDDFAKGAAGNAMHLVCVSVVVAAALACIHIPSFEEE
jgi:hypothetical protein